MFFVIAFVDFMFFAYLLRSEDSQIILNETLAFNKTNLVAALLSFD